MGNLDQPQPTHPHSPSAPPVLPGPTDQVAAGMPVIGSPQPHQEDSALPAPVAASRAVAPPSAYPRPDLATGAKTSALGMFGDIRRQGRWKVPPALSVTGMFGDAVLDLRDAAVGADEVVITGTLLFGDLKVIVPPGVDVELDGLRIFGDGRSEVTGEHASGAYRLRVVHRGAFSDVRVITLAAGEAPPKWWKSFW